MTQAELELEQFLKDNPSLVPFQRMLDIEMEGKTSEERMQILTNHILNKMEELNLEMENLKLKLEEVLDETIA